MGIRILRWVLAPMALALAMTGLVATPSTAITGNFVPDFEHEYVGLVVFYDADGEFAHRCSGSLISPTVFLTAGHCVTIDDETGELATSARIYFQQDAGADYDPETDTPATSGYPYTGGVTASTFYAFDYQGITVPATNNDVGLVILDEPYRLDTYGSLAAPGTLESRHRPGRPRDRLGLRGDVHQRQPGGHPVLPQPPHGGHLDHRDQGRRQRHQRPALVRARPRWRWDLLWRLRRAHSALRHRHHRCRDVLRYERQGVRRHGVQLPGGHHRGPRVDAVGPDRGAMERDPRFLALASTIQSNDCAG